jgi:hypothetical protein
MSATYCVPNPTLAPDDLRRFFDKVEIGDDDECWAWSAGHFSTGYPMFDLKGQSVGAHRVMCAMHHGLARGLHALHSCDNPGCVNPKHLRWGTHADNMADRAQRGRCPAGENHPNALLTDADVLEMRRLYDAGGIGTPRLAKRFGISQSTAHDIVSRKSWRHLA